MRAAQVAGDLINNDKVDLMMASGSPDTANPVADQCEASGCPSIANFVPWQPFFFGRRRNPGSHQGLQVDLCPSSGPGRHRVQLHRHVGPGGDQQEGRLPLRQRRRRGGLDRHDHRASAGGGGGGIQYYLSDLYPVPSEDFTKYISDFKKEGCEICCGTIITPDFTNFWKQAVQQGYNPKVLTIGKALLFPQTLEAIGDIAYNATVEGVWHPTWPFKDSITGKTCQELADDYMAKTGEQWTAPIGQYAKFEWAVDVFKRVTNLDDKEDIIAQVKTTKLETCLGPIDFTAPIEMMTRHPVENVYTAADRWRAVGQGRRSSPSSRSWSATLWPTELPVAAKVQLMQYS